MALNGIQIFKLTPKKNCKECGCPTCMAFSMKVAQGALELSKCPYMSQEALDSLSEATAPPMKSIKVGAGDNEYTLGGETGLYRHEKTFVSKTRYAVSVCTDMADDAAEAKLAEVRQALSEGCNEIDMVVNIGDVKNGDFDKVETEIRTLKEACGEHTLKVIIETCYLTEEEKIAMCRAVTGAGADYIKTSTGFGTGGATREDVELFRKHIGPDVKIKAAGGVSTLADLEMFINLGCDRIGTSRAVGLCRGQAVEGY